MSRPLRPSASSACGSTTLSGYGRISFAWACSGQAVTAVRRPEGEPMDWIDVSIPLREEMTVFTGEPPFRRERISAIADGAVCNISQMALGVHTGTHVDAPVHFVEGGGTAEAIALDALIGPAWVVDATAATGSITAADLDRFDIPADEVRLLFRTRTAHLWDSPAFEPGFVALDATAAAALVRRGVRSVGIDY